MIFKWIGIIFLLTLFSCKSQVIVNLDAEKNIKEKQNEVFETKKVELISLNQINLVNQKSFSFSTKCLEKLENITIEVDGISSKYSCSPDEVINLNIDLSERNDGSKLVTVYNQEGEVLEQKIILKDTILPQLNPDIKLIGFTSLIDNSISFNVGLDSNSISHYAYKIFEYGTNNVIQSGRTVDSNPTIEDLTLNDNSAYYLSIQVIDEVGNKSPFNMSDVFFVSKQSKPGLVFRSGYSGQGYDGNSMNQSDRITYVAGDNHAIKFSSSYATACMLNDEQDIYCWGDNHAGITGQTPYDESVEKGLQEVGSPRYVASTKKFVDLSLGDSSGCALSTEGEAYCWGKINDELHGDLNPSKMRHYPFSQKFIALDLSYKTVCAIAEDGNVYCWWRNSSSIGGDGVLDSTPKLVVSGYNFRSIRVSGYDSFACAIDTNDDGHCWGLNSRGQLGNNTTIASTTPVPINGSRKWKMIQPSRYTTNNTTCGIDLNDDAYCWGRGTEGQLGDGNNLNRLIPVKVSGMDKFLYLESKGRSTCGITTTNDLKCWGDDFSSNTPLLEQSGTKYRNFTFGRFFACGGLVIENTSKCWGGAEDINANGNGINGSPLNEPIVMDFGNTYVDIAGTDRATCVLDSSQDVYCWGEGYPAGVADNSTFTKKAPLAGGIKFSTIHGGGYRMCGLTNFQKAYCWGFAPAIGNGTNNSYNIPTPVQGDRDWSMISVGPRGTCGIEDMTQDLFCWGDSSTRGDGVNAATNVPVLVSGGRKYKFVSAGSSGACAIDTNDDAYCWGANNRGQLGNNTVSTSELTAVLVLGGIKWKVISNGSDTTCGLDLTGSAYCWGGNTMSQYNGALGNGTQGQSLTPTPVSGNHIFESIVNSKSITLAIDNTGKVYYWAADQLEPAPWKTNQLFDKVKYGSVGITQ